MSSINIESKRLFSSSLATLLLSSAVYGSTCVKSTTDINYLFDRDVVKLGSNIDEKNWGENLITLRSLGFDANNRAVFEATKTNGGSFSAGEVSLRVGSSSSYATMHDRKSAAGSSKIYLFSKPLNHLDKDTFPKAFYLRFDNANTGGWAKTDIPIFIERKEQQVCTQYSDEKPKSSDKYSKPINWDSLVNVDKAKFLIDSGHTEFETTSWWKEQPYYDRDNIYNFYIATLQSSLTNLKNATMSIDDIDYSIYAQKSWIMNHLRIDEMIAYFKKYPYEFDTKESSSWWNDYTQKQSVLAQFNDSSSLEEYSIALSSNELEIDKRFIVVDTSYNPKVVAMAKKSTRASAQNFVYDSPSYKRAISSGSDVEIVELSELKKDNNVVDRYIKDNPEKVVDVSFISKDTAMTAGMVLLSFTPADVLVDLYDVSRESYFAATNNSRYSEVTLIIAGLGIVAEVAPPLDSILAGIKNSWRLFLKNFNPKHISSLESSLITQLKGIKKQDYSFLPATCQNKTRSKALEIGAKAKCAVDSIINSKDTIKRNLANNTLDGSKELVQESQELIIKVTNSTSSSIKNLIPNLKSSAKFNGLPSDIKEASMRILDDALKHPQEAVRKSVSNIIESADKTKINLLESAISATRKKVASPLEALVGKNEIVVSAGGRIAKPSEQLTNIINAADKITDGKETLQHIAQNTRQGFIGVFSKSAEYVKDVKQSAASSRALKIYRDRIIKMESQKGFGESFTTMLKNRAFGKLKNAKPERVDKGLDGIDLKKLLEDEPGLWNLNSSIKTKPDAFGNIKDGGYTYIVRDNGSKRNINLNFDANFNLREVLSTPLRSEFINSGKHNGKSLMPLIGPKFTGRFTRIEDAKPAIKNNEQGAGEGFKHRDFTGNYIKKNDKKIQTDGINNIGDNVKVLSFTPNASQSQSKMAIYKDMCLELTKGWSLVGNPDKTQPLIYNNHFSKETVYTHNGKGWQINHEKIEPYQGFWVFTTKNKRVCTNVNVLDVGSTQLTVKQGWNLLSLPVYKNISSELFMDKSSFIDGVYKYSSNGWRNSKEDKFELDFSDGFWIYNSHSDVTIDF